MSNSRPTVANKRESFRKLHEVGCFVIPNPWNVGTARYLQGLGFKALATTSSGHAFSLGFPDGGQTRDSVLAHFSELVAATDIPLNADFENGFADHPDGVAENVTRCIATGVAGLSIEDSTNDAKRPLYDFDLSVARVKAARAAVDRNGGDVVLTARAENFFRGVPDLEDAIRRLKAYAAAGADCLTRRASGPASKSKRWSMRRRRNPQRATEARWRAFSALTPPGDHVSAIFTSSRRRRLAFDLWQVRIDDRPTRCGRNPDRRHRLRNLRIIESANPHEDEMWSRFGFAEEMCAARGQNLR
jgi:hypothetical protein